MRTGILVILVLCALSSYSQKDIRFSGVVLDAESRLPIENVAVMNRNTQKGAVSNETGYFSLFVHPGDTITFNDIRYKDEYLVVPFVLDKKDYGIIQIMTKTETVLDEVIVYSFPDYKMFRQSFLEYDPPKNMEDISREATKDVMATIRDAYNNDRFYYEMWSNRRIYEVTGQGEPNNFLNPVAWSNFIDNYKKYIRNKKSRR